MLDPTNACSPEAPTSQKTEDLPHLRLHPWCFVSHGRNLGTPLRNLLTDSGCIIAVLRLYYLYQASISTDLTYDNVAPATWSAIELNVGIICACIPALRPVISLIFPKMLSSTAGKTNPFTRTHYSTAYYRNESAVELSHAPDRRESGISHETEPASGEIRVKQDWTVEVEGRV